MSQSDDDVIRVGDLVVVWRGMPCCGMLIDSHGHIFKTTAKASKYGPDIECYCGAIVNRDGWFGASSGYAIHSHCLKKIKGFPELEREVEGVDVPVEENA